MFRKTALVAAIALSLALAGCSTPNPQPTATPSPTQTLDAKTPAQAKADYKVIAQASCEKAQAEGVVESGAEYTLVAVNKDESYLDFSAAYFQKPDTYELVWELTGLASCADGYTFSMADEAGIEAAIDVTFNTADGTYTTREDMGELGVNTYKYTVVDGLIAEALNLDPKNPVTHKIRYGNITEADRNILITAVDRFQANNN